MFNFNRQSNSVDLTICAFLIEDIGDYDSNVYDDDDDKLITCPFHRQSVRLFRRSMHTSLVGLRW